MKINQNTVIVGQRVLLVPYKKKHVPKYHEWMKSKELQELTASEPLTLEEEYQMQETWCVDEDKCTFIVLDKLIWEETQDEISAMIGDTNLFFLEHGVAEAEIMIAEITARGKGNGKEATLLMLRYGCDALHVKKFIGKIGMNNTRSISMFKNMDFSEVSTSKVFQEITLEKTVNGEWIAWLKDQTSESHMGTYPFGNR